MTVDRSFVDKPINLKPGQGPDLDALLNWLAQQLPISKNNCSILQFPGGYSNLTYQLDCDGRSWILRMPPHGADIKSAHDMGREFRVLSLLKPVYPLVPSPVLYCEDNTVVGRPFYLMEKVEGIILRNKLPIGLDIPPDDMRRISMNAVENLAKLHQIELEANGLMTLGKPQGYISRQVAGWISRYEKSRTEDVPDMDFAARWMETSQPADGHTALIHNDYKYDNLVLNPDNLGEIKAVLDWEMATIGDPLMDLGTTLAYWAEESDGAVLKPFNLTWLPGNLNRAGVVSHYAQCRGIAEPDMVFYFVFGSYKIAVIVQQIYARYCKGFTTDPRFAGLHHVVKACARNAAMAIRKQCISQLEA